MSSRRVSVGMLAGVVMTSHAILRRLAPRASTRAYTTLARPGSRPRMRVVEAFTAFPSFRSALSGVKTSSGRKGPGLGEGRDPRWKPGGTLASCDLDVQTGMV